MTSNGQWRFVAVAWAGCLLLSLGRGAFACGVERGLPFEHFDGVNELGQFSYWRQFGEIDFGGGVTLPLNINFRADRQSKSPYLGKGWMLSPIETSMIQLDENQFMMMQPNGSWTRFWRDGKEPTLLHGQGTWLASVTGPNAITVWADCGWKLIFNSGKIVSIWTPKNEQITFNYHNRKVTDVGMNGRTVVTIQSDLETGEVNGITYNDKKITFSQGQKPRVESIQGKNMMGGIDLSLHKVMLPDKTSETYDFAVDAQIRPTLKVSGLSGRNFTWDPASNLLIKDGDWNYSIKGGANAFDNAEIERTNLAGQTEYWFKDQNQGREIVRTIDGTSETKVKFVSGPFAGKNRLVTIVSPKGKVERKYQYDETGNLIQIVENNSPKYKKGFFKTESGIFVEVMARGN